MSVPPELLPERAGAATGSGFMSLRSIIFWSDIPATVPEKLDELSSCRVPVEPATATFPEKAEANCSDAPGSHREGSLIVKLFDPRSPYSAVIRLNPQRSVPEPD